MDDNMIELDLHRNRRIETMRKCSGIPESKSEHNYFAEREIVTLSFQGWTKPVEFFFVLTN